MIKIKFWFIRVWYYIKYRKTDKVLEKWIKELDERNWPKHRITTMKKHGSSTKAIGG